MAAGVRAGIFWLSAALAVQVLSVICLTLQDSPPRVTLRAGGSLAPSSRAQPLIPMLNTASSKGTHSFTNGLQATTWRPGAEEPRRFPSSRALHCPAPWVWEPWEWASEAWYRGSLKAAGPRRPVAALKKGVSWDSPGAELLHRQIIGGHPLPGHKPKRCCGPGLQSKRPCRADFAALSGCGLEVQLLHVRSQAFARRCIRAPRPVANGQAELPGQWPMLFPATAA